MPFLIALTNSAEEALVDLQRTNDRKYRKVLRALGKLAVNPRHSGLSSHKLETVKGPGKEEAWESYVENHTPGAWRIYWFYGPVTNTITVFAVIAHR